MNNDLLEQLEDMGAEVEDALDRVMGDTEAYVESLNQFPQNENITRLTDALEQGDFETAETELRALQAVAQNLGLLPVVDACMDMVALFESGDEAQAAELYPALEAVFHEFSEAIEDGAE